MEIKPIHKIMDRSDARGTVRERRKQRVKTPFAFILKQERDKYHAETDEHRRL